MVGKKQLAYQTTGEDTSTSKKPHINFNSLGIKPNLTPKSHHHNDDSTTQQTTDPSTGSHPLECADPGS